MGALESLGMLMGARGPPLMTALELSRVHLAPQRQAIMAVHECSRLLLAAYECT